LENTDDALDKGLAPDGQEGFGPPHSTRLTGG
jgi:hypothetical protein